MVKKKSYWGQDFPFLSEVLTCQINEKSSGFWHSSIELSLIIDLVTHHIFSNNDKYAMEIRWETEGNTVEKCPSFHVLIFVAQWDIFMNYEVYANLNPVIS